MSKNRYTISLFEGTINGWTKQQNELHQIRQTSLFHELQENLHRYQDSNRQFQKYKTDCQQIRLPLIPALKSNNNIQYQARANQHRIKKINPQQNAKRVLPFKMKTIVINQVKENEPHQQKHQRRSIKKSPQNHQKFRIKDKATVNFERKKLIGWNCLQFSDDKFFKDTIELQNKSKSKSTKHYKID